MAIDLRIAPRTASRALWRQGDTLACRHETSHHRPFKNSRRRGMRLERNGKHCREGDSETMTRYTPALLAAIRAGEIIDEDRFGLCPRRQRFRPLTLTTAMRTDRRPSAGTECAARILRRGQFTRTADPSDGHV